MVKEMICIKCPMSCHLIITINEDHSIESVEGNSCKRGEAYGIIELTHPMRILTSTVKLKYGLYKRLPVITSNEIPKDKLFDVMSKINEVEVCAPITINAIIIENVCGLNTNIIASRSIKKIDD